MRPFFLLVAGLILFPVCVPGAPIPKAADKSVHYFPTKLGDKWVYLVTSASGKVKDQDWVETVSAVKEKDEVKTVTISRGRDDGTFYVDREREVSAKGIVQTRDAILGWKHDSPALHLKLPHQDGQSWEMSGFDETLTAHGPEEVKVPVGTYQALRVEHRKKGEPKSEVLRTYWYAPHVGIIKVKAGDVVITLKSFTPGKG